MISKGGSRIMSLNLDVFAIRSTKNGIHKTTIKIFFGDMKFL